MTNKQNGNSLNITDAPTTEDMLDYETFVAPVVEKILQANRENTPLTIGVYGSWGSGKTSFLKMVESKLLDSDKKIQPIWFNAWKYDKEEDLWAALIQTILEQIKVVGSPVRRLKVRFQIWKMGLDFHSGALSIFKQLLSPLLRLSLIVIAIGFVLSWDTTAISSWIESIPWLSEIPYIGTLLEATIKILIVTLVSLLSNPEAAVALTDDQLRLDFGKLRKKHDYREHIAFLEQFSDEFQSIIEITSNENPTVIIIDDLDRCMPEKAVQVLETIKLFLDVKNCVFLLAVDRDVVEQAVLSKYKHLVDYIQRNPTAADAFPTLRGEDYFDKIVQLPIPLPNLSDENIVEFIKKLCGDEALLTELAPLFAAGIPANPRKVKRVILFFDYIYRIAKAKDKKLHPALLAKLIIIQMQYRQLYKEIVNNNRLLPALEQFLDFQAHPEEWEDKSPGENLNPIIRERVEELAIVYAPVAKVLFLGQDKVKFGELDLFVLKDYIYLVGRIIKPAAGPEIASVSQPVEESSGISSLPNTNVENEQEAVLERRYYHQLQQQVKKYSLQSTWHSNLPTRSLYIEPDFSLVANHDQPRTNLQAGDILQIRDLFSQSSRLFVIGSPGIGKTAFIQQIASVHLDVLISQSRHNAPKPEASAELQEYGFDSPLLPVILQAKNFDTYMKSDIKSQLKAFPKILEFCFYDVENQMANVRMTPVLLKRLEQGRCILFLDGLDELDDERRPFFLNIFEELQSRYPANYYVVTSRPYTVNRAIQRMSDSLIVEINPLTIEHIQNHLSKIDASRAITFTSALSQNDNLVTLLTIPIFLNLSWQIFIRQGMLPNQNQLIEIYLDEVIRDHELSKGTTIAYKPTQIGNALRPIALYLEQYNTNQISRQDVHSLMQKAKIDEPSEFLRLIIERLGILTEPRRGEYAFVHKAFQEYFRDYPTDRTFL